MHTILREALWDNSRIQIHVGKPQIWNRAGVTPRDFDKLLRAARLVDPYAKLWFGDLAAPPEERGIRVLGAPLGIDAYVRAHLQDIVFPPSSPRPYSCCARFAACMGVALVLCFDSSKLFPPCVSSRLPLNRFAVQHDNNVWHCLCQLIGHLPRCPTWERGSLPLHMEGVGLRSASRSSHAAYWGQLGRLLGNHMRAPRQCGRHHGCCSV